MSSLAEYYSKLVGFFSYSRQDDEGFNDELSEFRDAIQEELGAQLGRSRDDFRIWQDKTAIPHGALWENEIKDGIRQSTFFIPIITPRAVRSPHVVFEFNEFLARERELGRDDLVFPILYIPVPALDDGTSRDPVLKLVRERQYLDWRDFRPRPLGEPEVRTRIIQFCRNISNALNKPWETPEERQQRQEAESRKRVEEERRKAEQIEAERRAEEERQRREKQAALAAAKQQRVKLAAREAEERQAQQRAKQEERRKKAELKAQEREAEERRQQKAAAEERAQQEKAFTAAIRAGTIAATEAFLGEYPESHFAGEAKKLAAELRARENAYQRAMTSDDPGELKVFRDTYKSGKDVDQICARLRRHQPEPRRLPVPPTIAIPAAFAVVVIAGAVALWSANRPAAVALVPPAAPAQQTGVAAATATPAPTAASSAFCRQAAPPSAMGGPAAPVTLKLTVNPKPLRSIAISADGQTLATAGDDGVVRVWNGTTLRLIRQLAKQAAPVYSVAFSDGGKLLAAAGFDGSVRVWDAHSFAPMLSPLSAIGDNGVVQQYGVAFEPGANPRYLDSAGADGNVWIWNIANVKAPIRRPSGDSVVRSLSFAPHSDGEFVSASFDGKIRFFADAGKVDPVPGGGGKVLHVAYSPDAKFVASAGVDSTNKGVKVWSAANHTLFKAYEGHIAYAASVAWSDDASRIVSGGGAKDLLVRLWDVQSGNQLRAFSGHTADIEAVAFHPNRKWLISASEDGTMKLWDIANPAPLLSAVGYDNGDYLVYAPSGCYAGTANAPNYVKFVDAKGVEQDPTGNSKTSMFVPGDPTAVLLPQ